MASKLGATPVGPSLGLMETSSTQGQTLGDKAFTNDGRTFRYAKAGAVALIPGNVLQSPAIIANHVNLTPVAASAIGDTSLQLTLGATAAAANLYSQGTVTVELATTGAGQALLIKSHAAVLSSGIMTVNLEDTVVTATSGTVTMSLVQNNYAGVIQAPVTTLTGVPVGVAITAIPISNFGWIQTRGLAPVLANGAITVGTVACAVPSAAAGAAKVMAATLFSIGTFQKTTIDTQITPCFLTLD